MLQQLHQEPGLEMLVHGIESVGHGVRRGCMAHLHGDRGALHFVNKLPDVVGHGRREQQGLTLCRHVLDDPPDIGQKPHVEHAVRLVQDEHLDVREADRALVDMVQQPAGAGHHDLPAFAQLLDLGMYSHAAVDRHAPELCRAAQVFDAGVDLLGQLARRRDDQRAHLASLPGQQPLQDGQHKSRGLAGPGLGKAHHVMGLKDRRNRLNLDGGWRLVAERLDAGHDLRMELECGKTH